MTKDKCDRIHLIDFLYALLASPLILFFFIVISAIVGMMRGIFIVYLMMKGEPVGTYNVVSDEFKDKGLRFKEKRKRK